MYATIQTDQPQIIEDLMARYLRAGTKTLISLERGGLFYSAVFSVSDLVMADNGGLESGSLLSEEVGSLANVLGSMD